MLSVSQLCRCTQSLRAAPSKLLVSGTRNSFNTTNVISRQLLTHTNNGNSYKGLRLSNLLKPQHMVVRLCQSAPKPRPSKVVGYWLLGCSGMVFTAVVLGMVAGYLVLLYSIYYVVDVMLKTTDARK